ncbi:MAG: hypothetical protein ACI9D0_000074 [Bacteroidia bacterium]|jgi:hypothetical protein
MNRLLLALVLGLISTSCLGPSPRSLPVSESYLVVVNSVRLPDFQPWYTRLAEHAWIDIKDGDSDSWRRLEVTDQASGVEMNSISEVAAVDPKRWKNRVSVLETLTGAEAREAIPILLRLAESEADFGHSSYIRHSENSWSASYSSPKDRAYRAWPGPNSNTFVTALVEGTPGLHAELHHNSIGKDYPRIFRAGVTSAGWGLEADTGYLGLGVGLRQGIEVHFLGFTAGVGFWPPALKVPLIPRLGIHQGWVGTAGN